MFANHRISLREPTLFREPQVNNPFYTIYIILYYIMRIIDSSIKEANPSLRHPF